MDQEWSADEELEALNWSGDDEICSYTSASSLPKLQPRSIVSKARWDSEMGMAEVVEKKGKLWITTGIVRNAKLYCSIEETLFLAELGALHLVDDNDMCLSLGDIYGKIAEEKCGCCWELFQVYRHLKSLGYIVGRHGVPWTMKGVKSNSKSLSFDKNGVLDSESKDTTSVIEMLSNLQIDELRPVFDAYLPNSKFRKSSPGVLAFVLCFIRGPPPSCANFGALEKHCDGIPIKVCHIEHGRVSFFSFQSRVTLKAFTLASDRQLCHYGPPNNVEFAVMLNASHPCS